MVVRVAGKRFEMDLCSLRYTHPNRVTLL